MSSANDPTIRGHIIVSVATAKDLHIHKVKQHKDLFGVKECLQALREPWTMLERESEAYNAWHNSKTSLRTCQFQPCDRDEYDYANEVTKGILRGEVCDA